MNPRNAFGKSQMSEILKRANKCPQDEIMHVYSKAVADVLKRLPAASAEVIRSHSEMITCAYFIPEHFLHLFQDNQLFSGFQNAFSKLGALETELARNQLVAEKLVAGMNSPTYDYIDSQPDILKDVLNTPPTNRNLLAKKKSTIRGRDRIFRKLNDKIRVLAAENKDMFKSTQRIEDLEKE